MNGKKKFLALILSVMMVVSMNPLVAATQGDAPADPLYNAGGENPGDPGDGVDEDESAAALIYNLGSLEIPVYPYSENAEDDVARFDSDGGYVIPLEDDAFFPYEIQFKLDGETLTHYFDTQDSVFVIGGYELSVTSGTADPNAITRIGVNVGGEFVAAKPEPKEFTNKAFQTFSMLPIQTISASLDLTALTIAELEAVDIVAKFNENNSPIASDQTIYYAINDDNFAELEGTINLSDNNSSATVTLIVGSGHQLDQNNTRYIIGVVKCPLPEGWFTVYDKTTGNEINNYFRGYSKDVSDVTLGVPDPTKNYYLGFSCNSSFYYDVAAYEGHYSTEAAAIAAGANEITAALAGGTYDKNFSTAKDITVVYKIKSNNTETHAAKFSIGQRQVNVSEAPTISYSNLVKPTSGSEPYNYTAASGTSSYDALTKVQTITNTLYSGHSINSEYLLRLYCYVDGERDNSVVTAAYIGHFDSLSVVPNGATNIKDDLFTDGGTDEGYRAVFSDEVKITVFVGSEVFKYSVIALPYPGSDGTYFNITGAFDGTNTNVATGTIYRVPAKHDGVVDQFGYQVIVIEDPSVVLATLKPTFTVMDGMKAYVNGTEQTSGVTAQDFSGNPIHYTARSESSNEARNYWVSFVKAESGSARLYVIPDANATAGENKREIFFDDYAGHAHDIFIANIGDAQMTGLTVSLANAQNVKLDDYWTVGGAGNDALEAYDSSAMTETSEYLSNIAKIRLLPTDTTTGDGTVSGTLTISSANGGSFVITLEGSAQNPDITTTQALLDADPAVKYVPYSFMFQSDNKYSWNKATFSLAGGSLPPGMMIRPSGELYGVPRTTGTFNFYIRATFSSNAFSSITKQYTLSVLENTDTNVDNSVDTNYAVEIRIDDMVTRPTSSVLYKSEGEISEFIDLWLDGIKLTDGADYTKAPGSTVITVNSQTFSGLSAGTHTIAAEFRVSGDLNQPLKRTPQNFKIEGANGGDADDSDSSEDSGSSGGSTGNSSASAGRNVVTASQGLNQTLQNNATPPSFTVKIVNEDLITLDELRQIAREAAAQNRTPRLIADTMSADGRKVDVRIIINPALANDDMHLGASTTSERARQTKTTFNKYFKNHVEVISLSQKGSFGQRVEICVQANGFDVDNIVLYSYDSETNTYKRIVNPQLWLDANGYLHFFTNLANDVIISDGPLELK